ncbi:hypothetical protein CJ165_04790 [Campylobacter jejuni]|nr:hypothetical protein [Campylobacter jejuni]
MNNKEKILDIVKDKEWHCSICDFGKLSSQSAAIIRDLRKDGYEFESDSNNPNRFCQIKFCNKCDKNTIHRKLK